MIVKNFDVIDFCNFLFEMKLRGTDSRMRSRMVSLLTEHIDRFDKERMLIIEENALRREDGSIVMIKDENGEDTDMVSIDKERDIEFTKEYNLLLNEYLTIEVNSINKQMLTHVCKVVLDCDIEMSGEQANTYFRWCEELEKSCSLYV